MVTLPLETVTPATLVVALSPDRVMDEASLAFQESSATYEDFALAASASAAVGGAMTVPLSAATLVEAEAFCAVAVAVEVEVAVPVHALRARAAMATSAENWTSGLPGTVVFFMGASFLDRDVPIRPAHPMNELCSPPGDSQKEKDGDMWVACCPRCVCAEVGIRGTRRGWSRHVLRFSSPGRHRIFHSCGKKERVVHRLT